MSDKKLESFELTLVFCVTMICFALAHPILAFGAGVIGVIALSIGMSK